MVIGKFIFRIRVKKFNFSLLLFIHGDNTVKEHKLYTYFLFRSIKIQIRQEIPDENSFHSFINERSYSFEKHCV